jgi:hypothetical protein
METHDNIAGPEDDTAETEGLEGREGGGNSRDYMCRGGMSHVGAVQTRGVTRAAGVGDASGASGDAQRGAA